MVGCGRADRAIIADGFPEMVSRGYNTEKKTVLRSRSTLQPELLGMR